MQRTRGGLFKNWWGGGSFIQCMGKYEGRDSLEKRKDSDNFYTAARVNVYYKLSSFFFQCAIRSGTEILMAVCSFWIFFQESFLESGLHISMNGRYIFNGVFILGGEGTPLGLHLL